MVTVKQLRRFVGGAGRPGDLRPLLKVVGALAVSEAQRHFIDQEFDGVPWESRYPSQSAPKINIAGAVDDLNRSGTIRANRFDDRPAGIDKNTLFMSITSRQIDQNTVESGSNLDYADRVNKGGISELPVSDRAKKGLGKFLKKQSKDRRKAFGEKVGFLFGVDSLRTEVIGRQFIGVTKQLERDFAELVKLKIEGRI